MTAACHGLGVVSATPAGVGDTYATFRLVTTSATDVPVERLPLAVPKGAPMGELADALAYERGARFTLGRCYDCLAPCRFDAVLCGACEKVYADEKARRRPSASGRSER